MYKLRYLLHLVTPKISRKRIFRVQVALLQFSWSFSQSRSQQYSFLQIHVYVIRHHIGLNDTRQLFINYVWHHETC